jgi:cell division protein FtsI/penicillin-binding protein 2
LRLQSEADHLLGMHSGATVMMNAQSGEILVMASHPTFDPNRLDTEGADLAQDESSPLVNRAAQGAYPLGTVSTPFLSMLTETNEKQIQSLFDQLGFFTTPQIRMDAIPAQSTTSADPLYVSPLQMATAASVLSNHGVRPAPRIALAVNTPQQGWVVLPALNEPVEAIPASAADEAAVNFLVEGEAFWEFVGQARQDDTLVTWFIIGTLPDWQGTPLVVAVALEEDNIHLAQQIGRQLLTDALQP